MDKKPVFESDDIMIQEDLERIALSNVPFEQLDRRTVLVTGATGLIGSIIVKALLCTNRLKNVNIYVIALVRNLDKAKEVLCHVLKNENLLILREDITSKFEICHDIDYIIHGASLTSSKSFVENPVETISTAFLGTKQILEIAQENKIKAFVYLSSLEVYGITDFKKTSIKEEDYGYISPLETRSSYSEGKRICECLCVSYGKEYGVPVKIARLSQTFGAGVKYDDTRVFAEFARCIIEKRDIILHTKGETIRNYCYISDAVTGIFMILLSGNKQEAYNVANMKTDISIKEMALFLISCYPELGLEVKVEEMSDINQYGYNPVIKTRLDSGKLKKLGWDAKVNLRQSFERMIKSMRFSKEEGC